MELIPRPPFLRSETLDVPRNLGVGLGVNSKVFVVSVRLLTVKIGQTCKMMKDCSLRGPDLSGEEQELFH